MAERPCTLTGPEDAIRQARDMIDGIIAKGQGMPDPGNQEWGKNNMCYYTPLCTLPVLL